MEWLLNLLNKIENVIWSLPIVIWIYILYYKFAWLDFMVFLITTILVSWWYMNRKLMVKPSLNRQFIAVMLVMLALDLLYLYALFNIHGFIKDWLAHLLFYAGLIGLIYGLVYTLTKMWMKNLIKNT